MKKIIITTISLFFILFCIINASKFYAYNYNKKGNQSFNQKNFEQALSYHQKANSTKENKILDYNIATDYYKIGDYENAIKKFDNIGECEEGQNCFRLHHNKANTYYRIGESKQDKEQTEARQQAVESYTKALSIQEDAETRANLEFVKNKLKQNSQENQESDDNQNDEDQQEEGDKNQESGQEGKQENSDGEQNQENNGNGENTDDQNSEEQSGQEGSQGENSDGEEKALNDYETQVIDDYMEQLNNDQQQYQGYFNKKPQENNNQDPFEAFFQDPFFDQSIGNNEDTKDW